MFRQLLKNETQRETQLTLRKVFSEQSSRYDEDFGTLHQKASEMKL